MSWQVLRQNTTLQSLCIGNNTFGDEAASVLAEGLKQNSSLTKLDFQNKVMQYCSCLLTLQCSHSRTSTRCRVSQPPEWAALHRP